MKCTGITLKTLQVKELIFLIENILREGISWVNGDRYVKLDENKKRLYEDAKNLYGFDMVQALPYDEIKFDRNVK